MPPDNNEALTPGSRLNFHLEERSGSWVVVEDSGGIHQASLQEKAMWTELRRREQEHQEELTKWSQCEVHGLTFSTFYKKLVHLTEAHDQPLSRKDRERHAEEIRKAKADGWDEGYRAGESDGLVRADDSLNMRIRNAQNPYRDTARAADLSQEEAA